MKLQNRIKNLILSIFTFISLFSYIHLYVNSSVKYILDIFLLGLLFIFYTFLYKDIKLDKKYNVLIIIMSFILTLGYSYEITSTGNLFWGSIFNFLISIIKMVGYYFLIKTLFFYILKFLNHKFKMPKNKIIIKYKEHPFLYSFIFLTLCYGFLLILYYPGIINYDNANQVLEVMGMHTRYLDAINHIYGSTLTNFNPIVHTILLGGLTKIGYLLGNFNFGMFLYTIFQMIIVITIYSYVLSYAVKKNVNPIYSLVILIVLGIVPLFGYYSITAVKDTLYTAFLLMFSWQIYDLSNKDDSNIHSYISLFLISILVCLFRNNGIYIVVLTIPFLLIKNTKKLNYLIVIILIILSYYSFNNIMLPKLGVSGTSIRETLSIPFQQTARVAKVKNYPFSEEEKVIISKLLDYDNLANDYDETLSDPVKNKFNKDYETEDLINYLGVWAKGLVKYPVIYVDATINNISGYFNPFINKWKIYHKLNPNLPKKGFDYHYNNLNTMRKNMHNYEIFVEASPIGLFLNIAIITWLSILVFIALLNKKRDYIFLIPNIISILFCILSPANTYYRYIYPSLVLMVCLFPLIKNKLEKR